VSRDPFEGFQEQPYSLNPYQYTFSNPVQFTDPSGLDPSGPPTEAEVCWNFASRVYSTPRCEFIRATTPSPNDPPAPKPTSAQLLAAVKDVGFIEGSSGSTQVIGGFAGGSEGVWDLYDFEYATFDYIGGGLFASIGIVGGAYAGEVYGWRNFSVPGIDNYSGTSFVFTVNGNASIPGVKIPGLGVSGGVVGFTNPDRTMYGYAGIVGTGLALCLPFPDGSITAVEYTLFQPSKRIFHDEGKRPKLQDAQEFIAFIDMTMLNPVRKQMAKDIVKQNAKAWEAYAKWIE
jgi:hypothetical protein